MEIDGRMDDFGFTVIVLLDLGSSISRNGDELIWALGGAEIGAS